MLSTRFWTKPVPYSGALCVLMFINVALAEAQRFYFDIPQQRADAALNAFAQQAEMQILFPYDVARKFQANRLSGEYTPEVAIDILLKDTGLVAYFSEKGHLTIQVSNEKLGNKKMLKNKGFLSLLSTLLFSTSIAVQNTSVQAQVLEEIIVTAQKREQSLQDVSISVTAFTGEMIDRLGIQTSSDVASLTPGVSLASGFANQDDQFTIRGVVQTDFTDVPEPPNAVYVDEGYMAVTQGQRFGLFDIERVEILKGPQGTLFGRNATGGLAHFITRKPTTEFEAFGDVTYGSYDQVRLEGAISGPLTENLSARLSGMFSRHDGIIENIYPTGNTLNPVAGAFAGFPGPAVPIPFAGSPAGAADDFWNDDTWAIRGQFLWNINDDAELLISGFASRADLSNNAYEQVATTPIINASGGVVNAIFAKDDPQACEAISAETGACVGIQGLDGDFSTGLIGPPAPLVGPQGFTRPVQGGDLLGFTNPGGGGDEVTSIDFITDDSNQLDQEGFTTKLSWDFDAFLLTAISHYVSYSKAQSTDADAGPSPQFNIANDNETDSFTQEIRLNGETDRSRWVAGLYYLTVDKDNRHSLNVSPASPITALRSNFPFFFPATGFDSITFGNIDTDSYSVFGQIDYDLTDQFTLIAGLRLIQEEQDARTEQLFFANLSDTTVDTATQLACPPVIPFVNPFTCFPTFEQDRSDTLWSGKLVLEYRPNEDLMLYGGVNRGVKAGGVNATINTLAGPPLAAVDIPYDEEVLVSYEGGFKSSLFGGSTHLNASVYYYDYSDFQGFIFTGTGGFVRNVDAESVGIEVELQTRPVENLDLILTGSWIDATVENLQIAPGVIRDVEPTYTPEWQFSGMARYQWPTDIIGGKLALSMDFSYASERFHNIRNFDVHIMGEYVVANARMTWTSADDRIQGTFFINNITDANYVTSGFGASQLCGCGKDAYGKPRWFGGRIRYNWN